MIHIAICDDEKDFASNLHKQLGRYAEERETEFKITIFHDGKELIEKYDSTFDLIFLDIKMNQIDGLKAAEYIRKTDEAVSIIFLTTLVQHSLEGYKYQADNYIIKPMNVSY